MVEFSLGDPLQQDGSLRQQQDRRRGEQRCTGHRHDGANGAGIGGAVMVVSIWSGRCLRSFAGREGHGGVERGCVNGPAMDVAE